MERRSSGKSSRRGKGRAKTGSSRRQKPQPPKRIEVRPDEEVSRLEPRPRSGLRRKGLDIYEVKAEPEARSGIGQAFRMLHRLLLGEPIHTRKEAEERLTKITGLGVVGADLIASSAYATEQMMRILLTAGTAALALTMPLSIPIVVLLAVVTISYQQTIATYPSGGGSYIVAGDNLGHVAGAVAAVALMIDYILDVAVSCSAGVAAVTSALPQLYRHRVELTVLAIVILTIGNLRGIRSSGLLFSAPIYIYLLSAAGVVLWGVYRSMAGGLPSYQPSPADIQSAGRHAGQVLGLFLLLRAFATGAVALTGIEATSNGIMYFQKPETRNARVTLINMTAIFAVLFLGISFLAAHMRVIPDPREAETMISRMTRILMGRGAYYYVVQASTAILLALAANTAFADFPRLASILAQDKFLPAQFAFRNERLAFGNGIVVLSIASILLTVFFRGSVTALIPLFTVGVFIAFTLSEAGMVRHWWQIRGKKWRWGIAVNGLGALTTGLVLVIVAVTKFMSGAWLVLVLIPILVLTLLGVRRHLLGVAKELEIMRRDPDSKPVEMAQRFQHYLLVMVADLDKAVLRALAYAQSLTGRTVEKDASKTERSTKAHVEAVYVAIDKEEGRRLKERWDREYHQVPLTVLESPYRTLTEPLLAYLDELERQKPEEDFIFTVILPDTIPRRWWERFLYSESSLLLKGKLLFRPRTAVVVVPYDLKE